eukprot:3061710-Amphidinium_carterae.1
MKCSRRESPASFFVVSVSCLFSFGDLLKTCASKELMWEAMTDRSILESLDHRKQIPVFLAYFFAMMETVVAP